MQCDKYLVDYPIPNFYYTDHKFDIIKTFCGMNMCNIYRLDVLGFAYNQCLESHI